MKKRKKLIICADDFGMTVGINRAITELFINQRITTTSIMAPAHYFDDAVELVKKYEIPCGVHLTIATELDKKPLRPLLPDTPTDENGNLFPNVFPYLEGIEDQLIYEEFKAQILKVKQAGIDPVHIDSHMHPYSKSVLKKLSNEFSLPCRDFLELDPVKEGFLFHLTSSSTNADGKLEALVEYLNNNDLPQNVIVCHPTLDLHEIESLVSSKFVGRYNWQTKLRFEDFPCLSNEKYKQLIHSKDISLSHRWWEENEVY